MNIHEFQAKGLLRGYEIPVHDFRIVKDASEIEPAINSLNADQAVVKVQVHAGGRGKAGGVKVAKNREEITQYSEQMLGMKLVTKQTGKDGIICHQVMIAELADIEKEYYIGIVIDRKEAKPLLMVSLEGGMEIEEVAEKSPEKILNIHFAIDGSIKDGDLEKIAEFMQWDGETKDQAIEIIKNLCLCFVENDGSLLEINPFIEDPEGKLWALDAKFSIDENALFRHKVLADMYDPSQETPQEVIAHEMDLAYIALEGNIGCMVNGAGLAMATMDLIQHHGGSPANFLDVGGGADKEKVAKSFRLIVSDPNVRGILVNIFGGIMRCDVIAQGIIAAAKEVNIHVPLVVRLEGTNVEEGRKLLEESGLAIISAEDLTDAAKKIIQEVA